MKVLLIVVKTISRKAALLMSGLIGLQDFYNGKNSIYIEIRSVFIWWTLVKMVTIQKSAVVLIPTVHVSQIHRILCKSTYMAQWTGYDDKLISNTSDNKIAVAVHKQPAIVTFATFFSYIYETDYIIVISIIFLFQWQNTWDVLLCVHIN